jgi:hypothetical protein
MPLRYNSASSTSTLLTSKSIELGSRSKKKGGFPTAKQTPDRVLTSGTGKTGDGQQKRCGRHQIWQRKSGLNLIDRNRVRKWQTHRNQDRAAQPECENRNLNRETQPGAPTCRGKRTRRAKTKSTRAARTSGGNRNLNSEPAAGREESTSAESRTGKPTKQNSSRKPNPPAGDATAPREEQRGDPATGTEASWATPTGNSSRGSGKSRLVAQQNGRADRWAANEPDRGRTTSRKNRYFRGGGEVSQRGLTQVAHRRLRPKTKQAKPAYRRNKTNETFARMNQIEIHHTKR